ncbi:MAG: phosphate propanoyltransferase [Bacillota bacterium]|jgi:putative phosphotransacetylase|nr:phosphate propanoyltransferase [Bacillota bacterium]
MNTSNEELIKLITKLIIEELNIEKEVLIPIGVSNRHVHLCRHHLDVLFGKGYELSKLKDLKQPGQFASKELVTVKGPKGFIENVRILGPLRDETQAEISKTDGFKLGINAPVRESGKIKDSASFEIIGPKGRVICSQGTIVALRHIHMTGEIAERMNLKDKDIVDVEVSGERKGILGNVLIRVSDQYALEMHVDLDEANAFSLKNDDTVKIVKKG